MRNITTGQSSHGNNRDRTAGRELHRLFVDLRQVRIKRTGHRIFRRNLVHTVGHDCQSIGIRGHIGKQYQYFLIVLHRKIFSSSQCHIGNQQTFHRRILRRIHKADNTVECTGIGEYILEIQVVVIRHTHTTEDNLIRFGTQGHVCHYLVKRLVRVGKERNLLSGYQCIVQVDTGNTRCNKFRRLLTANRIYRRTTDLHFLSFNFRSPVDRVAKRIEKTTGKLLAYFDRRRFAQEHDFRIGRDTFGTFEHLQRHFITGNFYHLGQFAIHGAQLVIPHSRRFQRTGSFRNLSDLGIYLLKCFCCHLFTI